MCGSDEGRQLQSLAERCALRPSDRSSISASQSVQSIIMRKVLFSKMCVEIRSWDSEFHPSSQQCSACSSELMADAQTRNKD